MEVKFDWQTLDIFIELTSEEAQSLKRTAAGTPVLEFQAKDAYFHIMNSASKEIINVIQPRTTSHLHYWIKIGDEAYRQLLVQKEIGDRYHGGHKIGVRING